MIVFDELQKTKEKKKDCRVFLFLHCYQKHELHFNTRFIFFYPSDTVGLFLGFFFYPHPLLNQIYLCCLCFWM